MPVIDPEDQDRARADVLAWFHASEGPSLGSVTRPRAPRVSADGRTVALLGPAILGPDRRAEPRVVVVDVGTGARTEHADDAAALAWCGDLLVTAGAELRVRAEPSWEPVDTLRLPGRADHLAPSPDGRRLAVVVAPDQEDSWDPAPAASPGEDPYAPRVYRSGPERPRELWTAEPGSATPLTRVDCGTWNIWEAAWVDDRTIAVVASEVSGETGWYHPVVGVLAVPPTASGEPVPVQVVHRPAEGRQLAGLVAEDGVVAVVEGLSSDRGFTAGDVVLVRPRVERLAIEADATHLALRSGRLAWAGLRGLRTVAGVHDLAAPGDGTVVFGGPETFTGALPTADLDAAGALYAVVEAYATPPRLERITASGRTVVAPTADLPGTAPAGRCRDVVWTAPDGLTVEGLVVVPDGEGPHPLLMVVHGGPVACWRERWGIQNGGRHPIAELLAAHGIATFYPNPRGSAGRGQPFAERVRGDMCGADVDDLLTGIDHLVAAGLVDGDRVAVTGNSYGGMMSAWLSATTDRFRAAVVTSPATDLVSQHHLSNIPAFDELFVPGAVETDAARYLARSPISVAHRSTTPTLITAGGLDKCTPPSQAVELHQAIRRAGGCTELVVYPQQGHGVADFPETVDLLSRMLAWGRRFLLAPLPGD